MLYLLSVFFNDTATTEIYTLSLHDALPISPRAAPARSRRASSASSQPTAVSVVRITASLRSSYRTAGPSASERRQARSEEHTSELQSQSNLVCRLLLEKKKKKKKQNEQDTK